MLWSCCLAVLLAQPVDYIEIFVDRGPARQVFLTAAEREAVRARSETDRAARSTAKALLAEADALAAAPLDIPHKEGQWTHWYICPDDGAPLESRSPTEHVCSYCGKAVRGERYDQVYVALRHRHWTEAVETLGWAYAIEPKPAYAGRARAILLEYASFYRGLALHDRNGGSVQSAARLHAQTLDEAVALCQLCVGYDRTYDAPVFTPEDHETIETGLIRPMVEVVMGNTSGGSNWQTWHNAAVGCAGFVLRDDNYVEWAVNGPSGFVFQLNNSVLDSGAWFEESITYHWFALRGLVYLMEAASRADVDLYAHPNVKKMFDAPLRLVYPDLTFPPLNDSDRSNLRDARMLYEVAYKRFGDPQYAAVLEPRNTVWGLFWGGSALPESGAPRLQLATSNNESEGLAILRDATGETALYLDYGGAATEHIQPAKLGIILYAHGDERLVDPGRLAYGNPLHGGWYRETVAHNTAVLGTRSQALAAARLLAFANTDGFTVARAVCGEAYANTVLDRTLLMRGSLILDVFQCHASQETTIDLPLHLRGVLEDAPPATPCETLAGRAGYQLMRECARFNEAVRFLTLRVSETARMRIGFHENAPETFLAKGFGATPQELLPIVLRRFQARDCVFVTTYELNDTAPPPEITIEQGYALQVGVDGWVLELSGDTVLVRDGQRIYAGKSGIDATNGL
ncbi:MAG: heparinase II/III family protein [Candidatus Hydrogenedentes bacterium]|nr:heparinase II/III family protein [Candidatus Hydrogenedentota bacterium]